MLPDTELKSPSPDAAGEPPWSEAEIRKWIWRYLRGTFLGKLIAVGMIALVAAGWLVGQFETFDKLAARFKKVTTYATSDEITCLNEWVLKLAGENSETAAEQTRAKFLNDYKDFGHLNSNGEPIWINDVHVVRDPQHAGEWLVVIDMYPGASTEDCMKSGKKEMLAVLESKPPEQQRDWDNRIGRLLKPAEPVCYDMADFERTNGKVLNSGDDITYQRSLGSCHAKLTKPRGYSCSQGQ